MIRVLLPIYAAQLRETLRPTLLALIWLSFLILVKRLSLEDHPPTWPTRARSLLDVNHSSALDRSQADSELTLLWKDLEWASYRILGSLSTVTGLLLAFRSNSAIERWSTARRKWSDVQATSRSLSRLLSAPLYGAVSEYTLARNAARRTTREDVDRMNRREEERQKVESSLAAVVFFSISLMCEMRGRTLRLPSRIGYREAGRYEPHDLLFGDLLDVLPQPLKDLAQRHRDNHDEAEQEDTASVAEKRKQLDNLNPPPDVQPAISHPPPSSVVTNLALSSLVLIQRSLDALHSSHTLASPVYAHCIGLLNSLSTHMTELERIRDTPIPLSVSRHFSRLLVIHTALLPVVVVQKLDGQRWWLCALIVVVVTSMLYGVDSFAAKLGQPMGLDREDLPLERYVKQVQDEWIQMRSVGLAAD